MKEVAYLTEAEIVDLLAQKRSDASQLKTRRFNSLVILQNDKVLVSEKKDVLDKFDVKIQNDYDVIKGDIASKGKAVGRVCIILSNIDFPKFKKNDIIVAPTTRPDYVPFMKNSSAIVTNEGGTLSHAAILSRELGKPCIIGTKIATQVLKDGDLVEVDADKGVVTILENTS